MILSLKDDFYILKNFSFKELYIIGFIMNNLINILKIIILDKIYTFQ